MTKRAIVISASSDIGAAMCKRWRKEGWDVAGTYRTRSADVEELEKLDVTMVACDLSDKGSVDEACAELDKKFGQWDVMVVAPGAQEPVGLFLDCDIDEWSDSIDVNFVNQLRVTHKLLPSRNIETENGPCVLYFAGGGTNNAVPFYSAYTISKIALIKICELLDAEVVDTRFSIIGPGWVKTKIHDATLKAGADVVGANYETTKLKLASDECTPVDTVLDSCDWVISQPRDVVGGRNFSTVFDKWGTEGLEKALRENPDMYKLRRFGNDIKVETEGN